VTATHRALREEVRAGRFREDLMYRLRVVPIFLPALRERRGDVDLLLRRFLEEFNRRGPRRVLRIAPEAMRALLDHPWPGNVRELRNVVEYAFAVGRGPEILLDELPPEFLESRAALPHRRASLQTLAPRVVPAAITPSGATAAPPPEIDDEPTTLRRALERCDGRVGQAAALLGMSRATFWRKRRKHGV
jgi:DNA-binding NtrC family response regulator